MIYGEHSSEIRLRIVFDPSKYGFSGVAPITLEVVIACVFWGLVFTFTAVKGMGAIEKVSDVFAPLILIVAVVVGIIYVVQCGGVGGFWIKQMNFTDLAWEKQLLQ